MTLTSSLDNEIRAAVNVDFRSAAREIVAQVCGVLAGALDERQRVVLERLGQKETANVVECLTRSFLERKMGLRELASLARRELAVLVIKRTVPRFRAEMLVGMTPGEYFDKFYKALFQRCELPANSINVIDPNLHLHLKRTGEFRQITRSLDAPTPPSRAAGTATARLSDLTA